MWENMRAPCVWINSCSKEVAQECCRFPRQAHDLVGGLPVELEIEFGLGAPVLPVAEWLQLGPAEAAFRNGGALDRDTDTRRLPLQVRLRWGRRRGCHEPHRHQPLPTFVLAGEDE